MAGQHPTATMTSPGGQAAGGTRRSLGLASRLTLAFLVLVSAVLLLNGAINMALAYREARAAAAALQGEKAQAAAERVQQFVAGLESQMGWTTRSEWSRLPLEQRRYDFIRLLRQAPALTEVIQIDGLGKEQLRLSRLEPDSVASGKDYSADPAFLGAVQGKVWYGPVYFRSGSEPYMTLALAHQGRMPGVTLASVNLKLVWDVVTAIRVGQNGYAFVTDGQGKLVAYPDMSVVLRGTDLGSVPDIRDVLTGSAPSTHYQVDGLDGQRVLRAHAAVPRLGWVVFVDLPTREMLEPVWNALWQTGGLLALGLLIAALLGSFMASRTVEPIKRLQRGAEKLGEGDLSERVAIVSGDEIGILAQRFNAMAERIQEAQETLEAKVASRTRDLAQSLEDLRNAQERLVQTEKLASLGQLTAGIAHEIKNPLNFVMNFSELSRDLLAELLDLIEGRQGKVREDVREEVRELADLLRDNLDKVLQHGHRADSIVHTMLLHSRGEGGEHRALELNHAVEETLNLAFHGARAEMPGFNVNLAASLDPSAGEVDVYPQEFTRVLLNLFGNAFHALYKKSQSGPPDGWTPRLDVCTQGDASTVTVVVRDNGTGVPAALKDRIFEPFFTTKPAGEGTGLGLSLSHDIIVKQHAGRLFVDSQDGEGASFTIVIPRRWSQTEGAT